MHDLKRYIDIVQRLAALNYEVLPHGSGYIVRHLSDANDVSLMPNLDDLAELADLFEWRSMNQGDSG